MRKRKHLGIIGWIRFKNHSPKSTLQALGNANTMVAIPHLINKICMSIRYLNAALTGHIFRSYFPGPYPDFLEAVHTAGHAFLFQQSILFPAAFQIYTGLFRDVADKIGSVLVFA